MPRLLWAEGKAGFGGNRLPIIGDGLVHPATAGRRDAEAVVRLRVVGLDHERLLELRDRFVDPAAGDQGVAEQDVDPIVSDVQAREWVQRVWLSRQ